MRERGRGREERVRERERERRTRKDDSNEMMEVMRGDMSKSGSNMDYLKGEQGHERVKRVCGCVCMSRGHQG